MSSSGKYIDLWSKKRGDIENILKNGNTKHALALNAKDFKQVGNRKSYTFNLEFKERKVSNNIKSSAVARDLEHVLSNSESIKVGHLKLNMDKDFILHIQKI